MSDLKNWLIRTRVKQILGPVSKKKIIEFVEKGSLSLEDEITCGNGYWISVKERELLDKYLYGDIPMEFNPVSEAKPVLVVEQLAGGTSSFNPSLSGKVSKLKDSKEKVPVEQDLVYPEAENTQTENTQFMKIPAKASTTDANVPDQDDLSYPNMDLQKKK
jgi:hypothetical protein